MTNTPTFYTSPGIDLWVFLLTDPSSLGESYSQRDCLQDSGSKPLPAPEGGRLGINHSQRFAGWGRGGLADHGKRGLVTKKANKRSHWRSTAKRWWNHHLKQWVMCKVEWPQSSMSPASWLSSQVERMCSISWVANNPMRTTYFWPVPFQWWLGPKLDDKRSSSWAIMMAPSTWTL